MAKKSKTQKAKKSAARAARKAAKVEVDKNSVIAEASTDDSANKKGTAKKAEAAPEKTTAQLRQERRDAKMAAKENRAPRKHGKIVQFFIDVKAEMKRVTWPDKKDVGQWTGVVVGALVFFGAFVALLDNFVVTPLLLWIASLAG